ncbi:MAG: BatD family protein, partial [Dyella sp.]|nr:BatD family protein [Dyella sp.]
LRLFFAADLTNGALEDPQLAGVDVRRLGNEINYQAERGGRRYNVIERRYALTPQREGRLDVPPVAFQGDMVSMADPNAFFGSGTPVSASSPAVAINAKAVPAQAGRTTWLPARDLSLALDGGPSHGDLRVGQPLNLVMSVQATGLPYEALPALSLPSLDGATVYPDKPVNATHMDGQSLVGRRQQGFAIVPNRAGTLTIPETTLTWWNVATDQPEVARIPAQTFTVLPAAATASNQAPVTAQPTATQEATAVAKPSVEGGWPWRSIALASLALWLVSIGIWWWHRRMRSTAAPKETGPTSSPSRLRAAFLAAARGGDAAAQVSTLLNWARAERAQIQNLGELSHVLASGNQREAIDALQRKRYAGADESGLGDRLATAFRDGFDWRKEGDASTHASPLPPLYPVNLRR